MKKILAVTLTLLLAFSGIAYGASKWGSYKGSQIIRLTVDGTPVKVTDVPAVNLNQRTMIPVYLLQQAGIKYTWDQTNQTVNIVSQKPVEAAKKPLGADDIKLLSNRAVAHIIAVDDQGKAISQGSGFVARSDGLLVTAFHVAEEKDVFYNLKVLLNGKEYLIPKDQYVYRDKEKDVYITKLPAGLYDYIPFNVDPIKEKDVVYALGYPKGVSAVVKGEILAQRSERIMFRKMFVDHGTSGGALINPFGEAIGVIQTGGDPTLELGDATGGEYLMDLINR